MFIFALVGVAGLVLLFVVHRVRSKICYLRDIAYGAEDDATYLRSVIRSLQTQNEMLQARIHEELPDQYTWVIHEEP